ncbi:Uncharacterised protein [Vibrio cholerae]|nr:Uncharacterised protein [Vibrio cholerae]
MRSRSCSSLCSNAVVCECLLRSLSSAACSGSGSIWRISLPMYCSWRRRASFLKRCASLIASARSSGSGNLANAEGFNSTSSSPSFCKASMSFFISVLLTQMISSSSSQGAFWFLRAIFFIMMSYLCRLF